MKVKVYRTITCPCCETPNAIFEEYDICPYCGWEHDKFQVMYPDINMGANSLSLNEAKRKLAAGEKIEEWFSKDDDRPEYEEENEVDAAAVLIVKDGKILVGRRTDDGTLCGPGGRMEDGETPREAAVRETMEEFGISISLDDLYFFETLDDNDEKYGYPHFYVCTKFTGEPTCQSNEITDPMWIPLDYSADDLFPPFKESLRKFLKEAWLVEDCPELLPYFNDKFDAQEESRLQQTA